VIRQPEGLFAADFWAFDWVGGCLGRCRLGHNGTDYFAFIKENVDARVREE